MAILIAGIPTGITKGYDGNYFADNDLTRCKREQMNILISKCEQISYLSKISREKERLSYLVGSNFAAYHSNKA